MCKVTGRPTGRGVHLGRVLAGFIILVLGLVMLANRVDDVDFRALRAFPGMVLIAIGLARMALSEIDAAADRRESPIRGGLWLMTVGTWLIVNAWHLFGLTYHTSWPLLVTAGGVFIVVRGWGK